jgi:hypothetical protein
VKTHDFILGLLRHTQRFPKDLRNSSTNRLESFAFEFEKMLVMANSASGQQRSEFLMLADGKLVCLRSLLGYRYDLQLLAGTQIKYASDHFYHSNSDTLIFCRSPPGLPR